MRIFIFSIFLLGIATAVRGEELIRVIAQVNGEIVTTKDLRDYCALIAYRYSNEDASISANDPKFQEKALTRLIEDRLILDEAKKEDERNRKENEKKEKKQNFDVPTDWIESRLNKMISSFPSRSEFEKSLISQGLNVTLLRNRIKEQYLTQMTISKNVNSYIDVSPQEINDFYKGHLSEFVSPLRYVLWIVKSKDVKFLKEIARVIQAQGIAKAQAKYSDVLIKMESTREELRQEITQILMKVKEKSGMIARIDGVGHLIFLEKVIMVSAKPLTEVRDQINSYLWNKKFNDRLDIWVKSLKEKSVIKIYPEAK